MKFFIIFFLNLIRKCFLSDSNTNGNLESRYPFSIKLSTNEAAIFMKDFIQIYNAGGMNSQNEFSEPQKSLYKINITIDSEIVHCESNIEKGGIYVNGYYYTSCINNTVEPKELEIIYCNFNFSCSKIKNKTHNFKFDSSTSIRFFEMSLNRIGVTWLEKANYFYLVQIDGDKIINEGKLGYIEGLSKNIDCLSIRHPERTICAFGNGNEGTESVLNIFSGINSTSNPKPINHKLPHKPGKLRGNTRKGYDPENLNAFYYYFIDYYNVGNVISLKLESNEIISPFYNITALMDNCYDEFSSFDIAEDQFLGYDVFVCVDKSQRKININIYFMIIMNHTDILW